MKEILSHKNATLVDFLSIKKKYITEEELMDNAGMLAAQFFVEKINGFVFFSPIINPMQPSKIPSAKPIFSSWS